MEGSGKKQERKERRLKDVKRKERNAKRTQGENAEACTHVNLLMVGAGGTTNMVW